MLMPVPFIEMKLVEFDEIKNYLLSDVAIVFTMKRV